MDQIASAHNETHSQPSPDLKAVLLSCDHYAIPVSDLGAILIASPHPDDETLGCGGIIARCANARHSLSILAMTNGDASHPGDKVWRKKLGKTRQREQRNALKVFGFSNPDIIPLELPDGELDQLRGEMREQIVELIQDVIRSRDIRTLFVPAIDDCHGDHRETAKLLAQAAQGSSVQYIFSYQIWPPNLRPPQVPTSEIAYTHDISDLLPLKHRAVQKHRSQLSTVDPAHAVGFRMPQTLLDDKLKDHESYALVHDLSAWSQ